MQTTVDNQIAVIEKSIEIFRSAPEVLKRNQERTSKALQVGNNILEQWAQAWEIENQEDKLKALAAADERSNTYLVNCNAANKQQKEVRAAITQMMDEFKKMFTAAENEIDRTKAGTVPNRVQQNRDDFAKEVARIQEAKRKEQERIAAKNREVIEIKAFAESESARLFTDSLLRAKQKMQNYFNNLQLATFADDAAQIRLYKPAFKPEMLQPAAMRMTTHYHSQEETAAIMNEAIQPLIAKYSSDYVAQMTELRDDLVAKIKSKHEELKEEKRLADEAEELRKQQEEAEAELKRNIEAANEADKDRLKKEGEEQGKRDAERMEQLRKQQEEQERLRQQREKEEEERLKKEAEEAQQKQLLDIEAKKQGEHTLVMFEQEAALAETTEAPEARQGYEITVLHQAAYVQIFTLWFEKEGKNLPIDKIGNTKLDQMKAWAEKRAHKTGEKIDSKFLRYDETFKAVNKKAK